MVVGKGEGKRIWGRDEFVREEGEEGIGNSSIWDLESSEAKIVVVVFGTGIVL